MGKQSSVDASQALPCAVSDIPVREEASIGLSTTSDLLMFAAQLVNAHPQPVVTDKPEP